MGASKVIGQSEVWVDCASLPSAAGYLSILAAAPDSLGSPLSLFHILRPSKHDPYACFVLLVGAKAEADFKKWNRGDRHVEF